MGAQVVPALTVVVMGYLNGDTILAAVDSVLTQEASEPFEVVVVTSGDDGSAELVRSRHLGVQVVASPERLLPGGARNAGLAASAGEFIAFLAADCVAMPGWVEGRLRRHRAGAGVVAASMTNAGPPGRAAWAHMYLLFSGRLPGRPGGPVTYPDSAAHGLSYSRSVLNQLGAFEDRVLIGEDTQAARRLAELGVVPWFEPAVVIGHTGPAGLAELFVDMRRRGAAAAGARGESLSPIDGGIPTTRTRARLVRTGIYGLGWHLRWTIGKVRSSAAPDQPGPWSLAPWLLAGAAGRQIGRIGAQLRRRRHTPT